MRKGLPTGGPFFFKIPFMKTYTVEEIKAWLATKDSLGDAMYKLNEEDIDKAIGLDQELLDKVELVQTCYACPEQYDVFLEGKQIGYLRLRHGYFRADYPDHTGETVYDANPIGDGIFEESEREGYLNMAKRALIKKHLKSQS